MFSPMDWHGSCSVDGWIQRGFVFWWWFGLDSDKGTSFVITLERGCFQVHSEIILRLLRRSFGYAPRTGVRRGGCCSAGGSVAGWVQFEGSCGSGCPQAGECSCLGSRVRMNRATVFHPANVCELQTMPMSATRGYPATVQVISTSS